MRSPMLRGAAWKSACCSTTWAASLVFADLSAHGRNVVWFNPVGWTLWSFRDHRKLLIVDDTRAFVGGANIAPECEGDGVTHGWRDGGIEVNGPAVDLLTESFHAQLQHSEGRFWQGQHIGRSNWVKSGDDISPLLTLPGLRRDMFQHALRMAPHATGPRCGALLHLRS